jgi:GNAT superfamily N-acetyltransferase
VDVDIRKATRDDVATLGALVEASVRALSTGYYSPEEIERSLAYVFGVDTQLVDDGTYYVAESEGAAAGCGGWSRRQTLFGGDRAKDMERDAPIDPSRDAARIRAFFVHPAWARRGIGSRILRVCEDAARAEGFTRAELVATLPGVPLYSALGYTGFEDLGIDLRDGYVLRTVRMQKRLSASP